MHTVVVRSTVHDVEQGRTFLREQLIPRLKQAPGFVAAQWVRLGDNTGTSMITFETEEGARAAVQRDCWLPPGSRPQPPRPRAPPRERLLPR